MHKKKSNLINLGCRLNIYEGEVIKSILNKNNIDNYTVINSCAVTNEAEKNLKYQIRRAKRKYPNKKIVLTGCAAQINYKKYLEMKEIDFVMGNNEKMNEKAWKNLSSENAIQVGNIFQDYMHNSNNIDSFEGKARAYIEIQQGCDHRCTFCIIPYGRGNNRSVPVGLVVERIKKLVENNYNEIVLTGVDITDYGKDLPGSPNLFQLCIRILNLIPNLKRLRLSSIDCAEINEDFWDLLENKRLMPHFHLSLQSGSNLILKRMKRRHNREQVINFCNNVKKIRKDVVFGADLIAGFPTENDQMFKDTLNLVNECNLIHLHVFPFSPKENTPAARMPQVSREVIKKRASILRQKGKDNLKKYLKNQIGNKNEVLIEKVENSFSYGKSEYFTKIKLPYSIKEGMIVDCQIIKSDANIAEANII
ncbi:MAG: Threonylcarbamoyladenosine tRNA methylthiotransferase MtaB [Alphaproteobacteria bacterium MarineAlpha5_Bin9]|nr:MAG: Threonylcarbamoyladenosine tRNA methylthiotransferase MtaB [Alphaproteobacteria bacterium MarineAlpha5_Bin9]|tara:strand:+ start:2743 stop:4005 length:1263 start_codon:yes stop_codon:yes gene_type:complete